MKAIDRFYEYLAEKSLKPTTVEKAIGLSNGYLSAQKKRNADMGEGMILKIIDYFRDIEPLWLLTGEGPMLRTDDTPSVSATIATDTFDKGTVYSDAVTLRLMKKIDEKDAQIDELQSELRRQSAELAALKALRNKEAEYQSGFGGIVDTFAAEPSPDYGGGFSDMNPHPASKKSSAGKTYK